MNAVVLGEQVSVANQFLKEIRDTEIQKDRLRFRKNMERLGEIMAYEISKKLAYKKETVHTPLGQTSISLVEKQPIIITVLRAGLAYYQGFIHFFDRADSGFIGAYRKEGGDEIKVNLEYLATPGLEGRDIILVDPMLATGNSFIRSVEALLRHGTPKHIHLASLVASPEGINHVTTSLTVSHTIWTYAIDEKLDDRFYIVPGLGDAGDLSYGSKL